MTFPRREAYERIIYFLPEKHPEIKSSTLHLYTNSATTCFVRGSIWFKSELELRVFEYLDFSDGEILDYRYAILRDKETIRWYDPQPHPENPDLAETFPHHLHDPPDPSTGSGQSIKHNRKPAFGITFDTPNLPTLIADCIGLGNALPSSEEA